MVNDRPAGRALSRMIWGAAFVRVWGAPTRVRLVNNLFVGPGRVLRGAGELSHNLHSDEPGLVDRANFDYHLAEASPAIGAGIDPGVLNGFPLAPVAQYVHNASEEPRPILDRLDLGAFGRLDGALRL